MGAPGRWGQPSTSSYSLSQPQGQNPQVCLHIRHYSKKGQEPQPCTQVGRRWGQCQLLMVSLSSQHSVSAKPFAPDASQPSCADMYNLFHPLELNSSKPGSLLLSGHCQVSGAELPLAGNLTLEFSMGSGGVSR